MTVRSIARYALLLIALSPLIAACGSVRDRNPLPESLKPGVSVAGMPIGRFFADVQPKAWDKFAHLSQAELKEMFPGVHGKRQTYLAISGGGPDGAFTAGLLKGMTESGDRPEFTIVTGISTGALVAPFAFLGPEYDHVLEEIYTSYGTADLLEPRSFTSIPFSDSAVDATRFADLIARYVDDDVISRLAKAFKEGRRLWIGTTDLDAARPVMWNIGAIALSPDRAEATRIIRKVLQASASIPGVFPPVYFDFEVDGVAYDEMHVDGGTTSQVFLYPAALDWRKVQRMLRTPGRPELFVVRNSKLAPPPTPVLPGGIIEIAGKSVSSLIRTQGIGDLYFIYQIAQRDGIDYNLAYIPADFDLEPKEPFDQEYMRALYQLGYEMARNGYPWEKAPPAVTTE